MKICPFISHLLGDENSNPLTIGEKAVRTAEPDVVILGYGDDESSAVQTDVMTETETATDPNAHLHCLKESCRFYHNTSGDCQFDLIFSKVGDHETCGKTDNTHDLAKDIDKIWKFQTKGVTEIVGSLADSDKSQAENLDKLKSEFAGRLDELRETLDNSPLESVQKDIESLQKKIDDREEGRDSLQTTMSEINSKLEQKLADILDKQEGLAHDFESKLDTAIDARKVAEENLSSWKEEIGERVSALMSRHDTWEERINELIDHQKELHAYLEEGKSHRQSEKTRLEKKESKKYNSLGVTSFHNGAHEMARDQFLQAVKIDPEFAEAHNNLGLAYTELNEGEKATEAFTCAVNLNPSLHAAYNNLGYVFYKQGDYEQAIEMYNDALGRSTKNGPAYTNLGNAYYRLERIDEARDAWTKALELDPGNEKARRNLQRIGDDTE